MQGAGCKSKARSSLVNEEKSKAELRGDGLAAHAVAKGLAEMKALSIDAPKVLVIGSDQTLEFGDFGMLDKPASRADARSQLKLLRRSEEHTSELQSLMRISYAVFCLKKKNKKNKNTKH